MLSTTTNNKRIQLFPMQEKQLLKTIFDYDGFIMPPEKGIHIHTRSMKEKTDIEIWNEIATIIKFPIKICHRIHSKMRWNHLNFFAEHNRAPKKCLRADELKCQMNERSGPGIKPQLIIPKLSIAAEMSHNTRDSYWWHAS